MRCPRYWPHFSLLGWSSSVDSERWQCGDAGNMRPCPTTLWLTSCAGFDYKVGDFERSVRHYEAAERIAPGHPTIQSDLPRAQVAIPHL